MAEPIYARGCPERVSLKETYTYTREISRNQSTTSGTPTGTIEIVVPYDGQQFFTREACADVEHQLGTSNPAEDVEVQVGHLLLAGYERTNIKDEPELAALMQHDSLPIRVPAVCDAVYLPDHLYDDQQAALVTYSYTPSRPEVIPLGIEVEITDEESLNPLFEALSANQPVEWEQMRTQLAQQINFRPSLGLHLRVLLSLPAKAPAGIVARVARVALEWPTLTSFRSYSLRIAGEPAQPVLRYNPAKTCIEWENVQLHPRGDASPTPAPPGAAANGAPPARPRRFQSRPMHLSIHHPGEFYEREILKGTVEVEIKGMTLSDIEMRVFDGAGARVDEKRCAHEQITRIIMGIELVLDDAFAERVFFPYQHHVFPEIIPDQMRLADIRTTLLDYGFHITAERAIPGSAEALRHIIQAERAERQHTMKLLVLVEGQHYQVERQTELAGGQVYTSIVDSGEIKIDLLGSLAGDTRQLVRCMNDIQAALYERFARLRAKR